MICISRSFFFKAAPEEKLAHKASVSNGRKAAADEQVVTEEDIEGLISHAETVDEMAAATTVSKRQAAATSGRSKRTQQVRVSADEAVQPTPTSAAASPVEQNLKEEVRNERLMDLFRANKLDKVATLATSTGSSGDEDINSAEAVCAADDIAITAPNCHLVSDTHHLTQGDMLNLAKAKRSVYPFGFGRGAGHGSPSRSLEKDEVDGVVVVSEAGSATRKSGLRSAANREPPKEHQTLPAGRHPTVPAAVGDGSITPQHLGRTRGQSRVSPTTSHGSKAVKVTPPRRPRNPTPPMPAEDVGNLLPPRQARGKINNLGSATTVTGTTPIKKFATPTAGSKNDSTTKFNIGKPKRSGSENKTSRLPPSSPSASYTLRSKAGRNSRT